MLLSCLSKWVSLWAWFNYFYLPICLFRLLPAFPTACLYDIFTYCKCVCLSSHLPAPGAPACLSVRHLSISLVVCTILCHFPLSIAAYRNPSLSDVSFRINAHSYWLGWQLCTYGVSVFLCFLCIFSGGLECVGHSFCLCRSFCIFERCLDSNPKSCRSK